jgi:Transposase DDE domain
VTSRAWIKRWKREAQSNLERPSELYADGAYISGPRLNRAAQEGWTLLGPAPASPRRPGVERLPVEAFTVDIVHRRAHCPAGHESRRCSRICENTKAKISYRFKWRKSDCQRCPLRDQCVPAGERYRTLIVGEHHEVLQQRRIEQRTEAFELQMHQRNAIEGTISELARGHGLRRSRYRGFAKVELQNLRDRDGLQRQAVVASRPKGSKRGSNTRFRVEHGLSSRSATHLRRSRAAVSTNV